MRKGTSVRIDFSFKGRREDIQFFPDFSNRRMRLPAYWKLDCAIRFPLRLDARTRLALLLRGDNLLDRDYTEVAGFPSPGRSLQGGIEVKFR